MVKKNWLALVTTDSPRPDPDVLGNMVAGRSGRNYFVKPYGLVRKTDKGQRVYRISGLRKGSTKHAGDTDGWKTHYSWDDAWLFVNKSESKAYVLNQRRLMIVDLRSDSVRAVKIPSIGEAVKVSADEKWAVITPRLDLPEKIFEGTQIDTPRSPLDGSRLPLPGYYLVDLATGKTQVILKGKAVGAVRWFPDSTRFIARTGKKRTDLGIVDVRRPDDIRIFLKDVNQWDVWFPAKKTAK